MKRARIVIIERRQRNPRGLRSTKQRFYNKKAFIIQQTTKAQSSKTQTTTRSHKILRIQRRQSIKV
jgi:hypothetical protein